MLPLKPGAPLPPRVTVATIDIKAGREANFSTDNEHVFGLAPDYTTITPASFDGGKFSDIVWQPGSVGYLPPGVALTATHLVDVRATFVTIPDSLFKDAACETFDTSTLEYRWIPSTFAPILADLITTLDRVSNHTDLHDWPLLSESIATAMAARTLQLLGAKPRAAEIPHPGGLPPERLAAVKDYIESNIARPMRLAELAGVAMLSTFHFARAFKQSTNVTPVRYLWQRRVERAKRALRATKAPLVMIAYDCGFSSQSHFATSFKQLTGITPTAFRARAA